MSRSAATEMLPSSEPEEDVVESQPEAPQAPEAPPEPLRDLTPPKHHLSLVIDQLKLLHSDASLHQNLCSDQQAWTRYEQTVISKLEPVITEGLAIQEPERSLAESWAMHDVRPILDGLARFMSYAYLSERNNDFSGAALRKDLTARLYGGIGFALANMKLLMLQKVIPYTNEYNFFRPRHRLIQRVEVESELVGRIIEVRRVGLYDPYEGHLIEEAEVIVGVEQKQNPPAQS